MQEKTNYIVTSITRYAPIRCLLEFSSNQEAKSIILYLSGKLLIFWQQQKFEVMNLNFEIIFFSLIYEQESHCLLLLNFLKKYNKYFFQLIHIIFFLYIPISYESFYLSLSSSFLLL